MTLSTLARTLLGRCSFPPPGEVARCAVSGGPDSLALLVLATAAGCRVTAIHVDHGLRAGSEAEADVVRDAARRYGAEFRSERVEVGPGPNLEARARRARRAVLGPGVLTGHTADDQAETVIINLLRGAGLDGLSGMPAAGHPLLGLRRSETHELCRAEALEPVQDPSNLDPRHLRNRVRHELLPLAEDLARRDVAGLLARQAAHLTDEATLLDALAEGIDPTDARALAAAPVALARRAVRRWLRTEAGHLPDSAAVERVLAVARGEHRATELGSGMDVRRSRGRLTASGPGHPQVVATDGALAGRCR